MLKFDRFLEVLGWGAGGGQGWEQGVSHGFEYGLWASRGEVGGGYEGLND